MPIVTMESALRVHLLRRNLHGALRQVARAMCHQTIAAIRAARA